MLTFKDYLTILELLNIDTDNGIRIINGSRIFDKHTLLHAPDEFAIYGFTKKEFGHFDFYSILNTVYPPNYPLTIIDNVKTNPEAIRIEIKDLDSHKITGSKIFLLFEPSLLNSSLNAFRELIAHLRAPDGCPWDRKQDHQSLRTNLLEETYEVLDAIDNQDSESLKEELGDLLLQIVLHAQIAAETGDFNIFDIIAAIHKKITFRHPHVFEDLQIDGVENVTRNWEILKSIERDVKSNTTNHSILTSVPKNLPALSLAQKYQERAARVGFDWPNIEPVIAKIEEEIEELREADNDQSREMELGDILFAMVNLVRWYGYDAESVLRQMNNRFLKRFNFIESTVSSQGKRITDLTLDEMDEIWELAKLAEAG